MVCRALVLAGFAVAAIVSGFAQSANAQSPTTTRIEPRPFYGAVVTIEEGVRVFRPLPPTGHIIINPGHKTPLNLIEQRREESHNYHYYKSSSNGGGASGDNSGVVGGVPYGLGSGNGGYYNGRGYGARGHNHRGGGFGNYKTLAPRGHGQRHGSRGHGGGRGGKAGH